MIHVLLSHDIDYSKTGPSIEHINTRRHRFDPTFYEMWLNQGHSLYYGIRDLIQIEKDLDLRSTFFFRPNYETGSLGEYYQDIDDLQAGGWEVGLHVNNPSNIAMEKKMLEIYTRNKIQGVRMHMLKPKTEMYPILKQLGIKYDSSVSFYKGGISPQNSHPLNIEGVTVFPITFMDAYAFQYQNVGEHNIISWFEEIIKNAKHDRESVITIDWHDSSLKMLKGRMYRKVLSYLIEQDVNFMRGIDACKQLEVLKIG